MEAQLDPVRTKFAAGNSGRSYVRVGSCGKKESVLVFENFFRSNQGGVPSGQKIAAVMDAI